MDSTVTIKWEVTIKGVPIKYSAITGKQPVRDENGKIIAGLYFTFYERSDVFKWRNFGFAHGIGN